MGKRCLGKAFICLMVLAWACPGFGGEPTEKIKQTTDKILAILSNPKLKAPSSAQERRKAVNEAIDERFDWKELARRSLARHWVKRTPDERRKFIDLYRQLLERTYLDKVEDYSGETVHYEGETIDGNYAIVRVKILTGTNKEIPVDYRMMKKDTTWMVYDISIEGVSLVNNYRSQFNSILVKSSFADLLDKLKEKITSPKKN